MEKNTEIINKSGQVWASTSPIDHVVRFQSIEAEYKVKSGKKHRNN